MWFSLSDQTVYFLASIAFGAALGVLYDIIRALRIFFRFSRAGVIVSDILFFAAAGALTSLFALPFNKGSVRAFIVFGEAVGFLAFRLTLGSVSGRMYESISRLLRLLLQKICIKLKKIYDLLLKAIGLLLYNIVDIIVGAGATARSGVRVLASDVKKKRAPRRKNNTPYEPKSSAPTPRNNKASYNKEYIYERKKRKNKDREQHGAGRRGR